jgi:hypothetical protein
LLLSDYVIKAQGSLYAGIDFGSVAGCARFYRAAVIPFSLGWEKAVWQLVCRIT